MCVCVCVCVCVCMCVCVCVCVGGGGALNALCLLFVDVGTASYVGEQEQNTGENISGGVGSSFLENCL